MEDESLHRLFRRVAEAERLNPRYEEVDEGSALIDKLENGVVLNDSETKRLSELIIQNSIIRQAYFQMQSGETGAKRSTLPIPLGRLPLAIAAAILMVLTLWLAMPKDGTSAEDSFGGRLASAHLSVDSLFAMSIPPAVDTAEYLAKWGGLVDRVNSEPSVAKLAEATAAALGARRFEDANAFAARWLELEPKSVEALNAGGIVFLASSKNAKAIKRFNTARELAPNDSDILANLLLAHCSDPNGEPSVILALEKELRAAAPKHPLLIDIEPYLRLLKDGG